MQVRLKANHYDTFFAADAVSGMSEARKCEPDFCHPLGHHDSQVSFARGPQGSSISFEDWHEAGVARTKKMLPAAPARIDASPRRTLPLACYGGVDTTPLFSKALKAVKKLWRAALRAALKARVWPRRRKGSARSPPWWTSSSCTKTPVPAQRHQALRAALNTRASPRRVATDHGAHWVPDKTDKTPVWRFTPLTPSGALGRLRRNATRSGMPARRERGLVRNRTVDHPREASPSTSLELAAVGALARLVRSCLYRRI